MANIRRCDARISQFIYFDIAANSNIRHFSIFQTQMTSIFKCFLRDQKPGTNTFLKTSSKKIFIRLETNEWKRERLRNEVLAVTEKRQKTHSNEEDHEPKIN